MHFFGMAVRKRGVTLNLLQKEGSNFKFASERGGSLRKGGAPTLEETMDYITHMHGFAVYVKEGLPFAAHLSRENSTNSYLCFQLALVHSVWYFFPSVDCLLQLYVRFLILFHLT